MYSLVLMAAVGAGPVAPTAGPGAGCYGCSGAYAGCSGYTSCHGCYGSCHGRGFLGHHKSNCHGCSGCNGCRGGGLFGHHKRNSCHGCSGCWGSSCHGCYGSSCYGSSCYGGGGFAGCSGSCHGCFGGYAYPAYQGYPVIPPAVVVPTETKPDTKPETKPEDKKKNSDSNNPASLKFELPEGAVLFVDGRQTPGHGAERTFVTPPLASGQKYFYDVRAEVVVAGVTVVEEKRVIVEAGISLNESFPKLIAAVTAPTMVAGK